MTCHFIGLYKNQTLAGVVIAQFIDLTNVTTFKDKKTGFYIKEYLFKKFTSYTLFIGNNMLTGQNAYLLANTITEQEALQLIRTALNDLKKLYKRKRKPINIVAIKDFNNTEFPDFKSAGYKGFYTFTTQPNMIFDLRTQWVNIDDYLADLTTKYRTQYKRARKKADGIIKKKFTVDDITHYRKRIIALYCTVADRASFNTFYLPENHFEVMKRELGDKFIFSGYFDGNTLIGFSTLIKNNTDIDTYFLGYDETVQKEKMLYLNMLYDMLAYSIEKKYNRVIFARSAMEIKSSIGAKAEPVRGIIKHTNPLLNYFMAKLFSYFEPEVEWKVRNPFKVAG